MAWKPSSFEPASAPAKGAWKPSSFEAAAPAPAAEPVPDVGMGEAAFHGAGQGATLGFGDEINGAIQAVGDKVSGSSGSLGDLYRYNRDAFRREDQAASKAHPIAYGAGELAGGAPITIASGAALGGVGGAMALGGISGLGSSDADLTKGDLYGAAKDTAIGASMGAVAHGIGAGIAKGAGALHEMAGSLGYRATGGMLKDVRQLGAKNVAEAGNSLLDKGVVGFGNSAENIAAKAAPAARDTGQQLTAVKAALDQKGATWDPKAVQQQIESEIVAPLQKTASGREIAARMQEEANAIGATGNGQPQPISGLADEITGYGKKIKWASGTQDPSRDAYKSLRGLLDKHFDAQARAVSPDLMKLHNSLQADAHLLMPAAKTSQDMAARTAANRLLSLGDRVGAGAVGTAAGALGADDPNDRTAGAILGGLGGAAIGRLARTRGAASGAVVARLAARGLGAVAPAAQVALRGAIPAAVAGVQHVMSPRSRVASAAQRNPAALGKYAGVISRSLDPAQGGGKSQFATMNYVLSKDPHYQQMTQALPEQDMDEEE